MLPLPFSHPQGIHRKKKRKKEKIERQCNAKLQSMYNPNKRP